MQKWNPEGGISQEANKKTETVKGKERKFSEEEFDYFDLVNKKALFLISTEVLENPQIMMEFFSGLQDAEKEKFFADYIKSRVMMFLDEEYLDDEYLIDNLVSLHVEYFEESLSKNNILNDLVRNYVEINKDSFFPFMGEVALQLEDDTKIDEPIMDIASRLMGVAAGFKIPDVVAQIAIQKVLEAKVEEEPESEKAKVRLADFSAGVKLLKFGGGKDISKEKLRDGNQRLKDIMDSVVALENLSVSEVTDEGLINKKNAEHGEIYQYSIHDFMFRDFDFFNGDDFSDEDYVQAVAGKGLEKIFTKIFESNKRLATLWINTIFPKTKVKESQIDSVFVNKLVESLAKTTQDILAKNPNRELASYLRNIEIPGKAKFIGLYSYLIRMSGKEKGQFSKAFVNSKEAYVKTVDISHYGILIEDLKNINSLNPVLREEAIRSMLNKYLTFSNPNSLVLLNTSHENNPELDQNYISPDLADNRKSTLIDMFILNVSKSKVGLVGELLWKKLLKGKNSSDLNIDTANLILQEFVRNFVIADARQIEI
jgi:hypothetical protein